MNNLHNSERLEAVAEVMKEQASLVERGVRLRSPSVENRLILSPQITVSPVKPFQRLFRESMRPN